MAAQAVPGAGLLKGLGVTIKHMFKPAVTQQYPHVRPELPPRTRGVIALMDENCTVCMLCARECPDWCIYIDSHKETVPPAKEGGRARTRNVLDRFAIDFALCMYCGICIEVCPFDALFWSPEFEYAEYSIAGLLHEKPKLREWMDTVPPPPALDHGADSPSEVADAIEKAQKELQAARAAEEQQAAAAAAPAAEAEGGGGAAAPAGKEAAEEPIEVEAGEIDQETFDKLIAEGKSERMARAKAKAAYVRKRKAEIRAERETAGGDDEPSAPATPAEGDTPAEAATAEAPAEAPAPSPTEAPAPKKAEIHVEAGEIDQETYDQLIAEGKSERIARSKAKAAYVRKKRKELSEEEGGGE